MHAQQVYNGLGTQAVPVTLTTLFADNIGPTVFANLFKKVAFDVRYTPTANGAYAQLRFEYSQDPIGTAVPANFRPFAVTISATNEVDVYAKGGNNMGTLSGTPIDVPTAGTSIAADVVNAHFMPDTDLVANWIRVEAQEVTTGAGGTLFVQMTLQQ